MAKTTTLLLPNRSTVDYA